MEWSDFWTGNSCSWEDTHILFKWFSTRLLRATFPSRSTDACGKTESILSIANAHHADLLHFSNSVFSRPISFEKSFLWICAAIRSFSPQRSGKGSREIAQKWIGIQHCFSASLPLWAPRGVISVAWWHRCGTSKVDVKCRAEHDFTSAWCAAARD